MFPIRQIDRLQAENLEYLGTKRKFWFSMGGVRYLFKAEERGTGEDWAEKVVCELARRLGLPHVEYELAHEYEGTKAIQPGVICANFTPRPLALVMGNELLVQRDPAYPAETDNKYRVRAYTVKSVVEVVRALKSPSAAWMPGAPVGIVSALDVFAGYTMLDAWVANQDRHHQNWGAIREAGVLGLAPTYDHGSSLARNLDDSERVERLGTKDQNFRIERFVTKARSGFYATPADRKTLYALDAFWLFAEFAPGAARIWLDRLQGVHEDEVREIIERVPSERMSPITKKFTFQLLKINQGRLLEGPPSR